MVLEFSYPHIIPRAMHISSLQQVVKIALLDSRNECLPFIAGIAQDGAAGFPGISDQNCLIIGRYLDARPSVAAEGGAPGEASGTPSIYHNIIS